MLGSKIFYRVIVVTPDLKPAKEIIKVRIEDPQQNTISQLLEQQLHKGKTMFATPNYTRFLGVFAGELQLASEPVSRCLVNLS